MGGGWGGGCLLVADDCHAKYYSNLCKTYWAKGGVGRGCGGESLPPVAIDRVLFDTMLCFLLRSGVTSPAVLKGYRVVK